MEHKFNKESIYWRSWYLHQSYPGVGSNRLIYFAGINSVVAYDEDYYHAPNNNNSGNGNNNTIYIIIGSICGGVV